ncbi:PaaI family thioesterase [Deinococcus sonorensis]|uniref:PaaI family thioesterase n=2 Tax=Deinococcus sonorensis TaxID=309891 RepID=A0AAU7U6S9_9DEIO
MMDFDLNAAQRAIAADPFSRLLGTQVTAAQPGQVELSLEVRPTFLHRAGTVHEGLLSSLADTALACAGGSVLGPQVVTASMHISYVEPAEGTWVAAQAQVIRAGRRTALCRCSVVVVKQGTRVLCATAQGTIVAVGNASRTTFLDK